MSFIIYGLFEDKSSIPFYIGKTREGRDRLSQHIYSANKHRKTARDKKILQLISRNIDIRLSIIFSSPLEQEAFAKEKELIKFYGRKDNGTGILCNHTDGGEGLSGFKHTEELRQKQSLRQMGTVRPQQPSKKAKRVSVYNLEGKLVSRHESIVHAAKQYGINPAILSNVLSNKLNTFKSFDKHYRARFGFEDTLEPLDTVSLCLVKPVLAIRNNQELKFSSQMEASRVTGVAHQHIYRILRKKQKTAKGYDNFRWTFKYYGT